MIPIGTIVLWSGLLSAIPADWHLCDGTAGTPDLNNRFVKGNTNVLKQQLLGGADTHTHTFTGDGHFHYSKGMHLASSAGTHQVWDFELGNDITGTEFANGETELADNQPAFMKLAYIMKIA